MNDNMNIQDACGAGLIAANGLAETFNPRGVFKIECRAADGSLRWVEEFSNLVVNDGKNDILNKYFLGSGYTAAWYIGLKNTGTPVAGDTMASHGSWTENTTYSNATRPAFSPASSTAQSSTNSATPATFSINGTTTIFGAFITSSNTKGGTTGVLFCAADFASSRAVVNGDTLNVTYTVSC